MLALLVTGELSLKTEACPAFYGVFGALVAGDKHILDSLLDQVNATEPEKAAFENIQECFNEEGIKGKTLDVLGLGSIAISAECLSFTGKEIIEDIKNALSKLNPFSR
ncbi:androgen-binding protein homolog isoform X2 [Nycticebus coucang]|uniref:androgen-binding protein homolog isoform X2 n=1 Tax=Nycticebus coucang TaxID=9470 RepID=UPI00234DF49C|nr:androgen-binding protein homolog isoform X2 [Nycticebus coucang]